MPTDVPSAMCGSAQHRCMRQARCSIQKQAGLKSRGSTCYAIVIEMAEGNYSAYAPDLPGCVATGATVTEVEAEIREAIVFHLGGLHESACPSPTAHVKSNTSRRPA